MRMKYLLLCFGLIILKALNAQDSSVIKKNQVYLELLGNNFADPNSSVDASLYSVNYCRKVIIKKNCLLFSLGVGTLKENGYDPIGMRSTNITLFNFPAGILWRYNYKRNGLLVGVFFTAIFGEISYISAVDHYNSSYQVSPNLSYQYQSRSEHFFFRVNFTPKLLAYMFSDKYSNQYGDQPRVFLWGGISIGGGW
ncbi:hypothetical protein BH11BAC7_BH11BAC7_23180 [soil metagenome]